MNLSTQFLQQTKRDARVIMAPLDAPRWYDGEPKKKPRGMFRRVDAISSLWLIRVVVNNPRVQVDHG